MGIEPQKRHNTCHVTYRNVFTVALKETQCFDNCILCYERCDVGKGYENKRYP